MGFFRFLIEHDSFEPLANAFAFVPTRAFADKGATTAPLRVSWFRIPYAKSSFKFAFLHDVFRSRGT